MTELNDLPELMLVNIFQFFIDRVNYHGYRLFNGRGDAPQSYYNLVLNYKLVNNQFNNIVHMTTRDDAYIGFCQYMYLHYVIPNTFFLAGSDPFENHEIRDLVAFDIRPYDDSWSSSASPLVQSDPCLCKREDVEGIVKILTLNEKYALGKVRLSSTYIEQ